MPTDGYLRSWLNQRSFFQDRTVSRRLQLSDSLFDRVILFSNQPTQSKTFSNYLNASEQKRHGVELRLPELALMLSKACKLC